MSPNSKKMMSKGLTSTRRILKCHAKTKPSKNLAIVDIKTHYKVIETNIENTLQLFALIA